MELEVQKLNKTEDTTNCCLTKRLLYSLYFIQKSSQTEIRIEFSSSTIRKQSAASIKHSSVCSSAAITYFHIVTGPTVTKLMIFVKEEDQHHSA